MPDRSTISIARVPLARAPLRLLAAPALLLTSGAVAAGGGVVVGAAAGVGLVAAGLVVAVLAIYLALVPFSVRLDVEVAALRLRWLGGDRRFGLVRGAVTRVPLLGEGAARVRPRFGAFGWAIGPARLRGSEQIQLIRLARSPSVILVPTDAGRLAIAAASERQLLDALEAAARVQQRLDEVAGRARAFQPEPELVEPPAPPVEVELEPAGATPAARMLTGIERTLLEERLAAQRAVALAAAEAFFGRALHADVVAEAFTGLRLPGRFEVLHRAPLLVLDGAHNPDGAATVAATLADEFDVAGTRHWVLGMLVGRDLDEMLDALGVHPGDRVVTTTPPSPRG
ncbi:MAG: glutamate ligase domain-containing protein, partial [Candidatus Limnocylindria bacterium]